MASFATASSIALCSSFHKSSNHHFPPQNISICNTHFGFLPKSHILVSTRPAFSLIPRFSPSIAPAIEEATTVEVEPESIQSIEVAVEKPKREEVFAVVMIGGRQYIVFPGRFLYVQRLKGANVNDQITMNKVLLVGTKTSTYIGQPLVTNASVHAIVEEQGLDAKKIVFKYKKKKHYRRNIGHRQPNSRIRITAITGYQDFPAVTLDSIQEKVGAA